MYHYPGHLSRPSWPGGGTLRHYVPAGGCRVCLGLRSDGHGLLSLRKLNNNTFQTVFPQNASNREDELKKHGRWDLDALEGLRGHRFQAAPLSADCSSNFAKEPRE